MGKSCGSFAKGSARTGDLKSCPKLFKSFPAIGVRAATQTVTETFKENCLSIKECDLKVNDCVQAVDKVNSAERRDSEEQKLHPKASSPELPAEGKRQAKLLWDGLAEEARNAAKISATELLLEKAEEGPPPYAAKDCTESLGENRNVVGLECLLDNGEAENKEGLLDSVPVANENKDSLFDNADTCKRQKGGELKGGIKASQNLCQKARFSKAISRRRGEPGGKGWLIPERKGRGPRGKGRPSPEGKGQGRSLIKRLRSREAASQSTSGSESDSSSEDWDSQSSAADSGSGFDKEEVTV
ncbi:hypothetical protein DUI87_13076 [Hirundo rustica rustica]|uniref:Uncharacterized protein n=1 Tax=Hirundo rustica rustica TaxID=333673 RepID=A0A3M0KGB2_HIRRU|nr:hypothetical protein DUI87_13076 [Hirundo rustica rustica]